MPLETQQNRSFDLGEATHEFDLEFARQRIIELWKKGKNTTPGEQIELDELVDGIRKYAKFQVEDKQREAENNALREQNTVDVTLQREQMGSKKSWYDPNTTPEQEADWKRIAELMQKEYFQLSLSEQDELDTLFLKIKAH